MQSEMRYSPVRDEHGKNVQDAYVMYDPDLRRESRYLEQQHVAKYAHECTDKSKYFVKSDGTICSDGLDPIDPDFIKRYIEIERAQARRTARRIGGLAGHYMPVLYAPDSAVHVAKGILDGFDEIGLDYELFPVDKNEPIPGRAITRARIARQILFCDSVIHNGKASAKTLEGLWQMQTPINVITYFSHGTALEASQDGALRDDSMPLKGLEGLRSVIRSAGHYNRLIVADIGAKAADFVDRADAISYAARHYPEMLEYVRMFQKPEAHNASDLIE